MVDIVPLNLLQPGEQGCVLDVSGDAQFISRLAEMGLQAGTQVKMLRPGSPCIIDIHNHRLSLRTADDSQVLVEVQRKTT